jgi:predicted Zn-dependent protease
LGRAGPYYLRSGSNLPVDGMMEFDVVDASGYSDFNWKHVILHEMGHIIGLGGEFLEQASCT